MSISITVTGNSEVARLLRGAADIITGDHMELALVAGAMPLVNAAKINAPVLSGTLRRSLHIGGHTFEEGGSDIGGNSPNQIRVGTNLAYAEFVERGTSKMAAQPYLRPAMDETRQQVVQEVANALRDLLAASGA